MNPVVHFEMPAEDRGRVAAFYTEVFGWQTQFLGPQMGDYVLAMTTESGPDGLDPAGLDAQESRLPKHLFLLTQQRRRI